MVNQWWIFHKFRYSSNQCFVRIEELFSVSRHLKVLLLMSNSKLYFVGIEWENFTAPWQHVDCSIRLSWLVQIERNFPLDVVEVQRKWKSFSPNQRERLREIRNYIHEKRNHTRRFSGMFTLEGKRERKRDVSKSFAATFDPRETSSEGFSLNSPHISNVCQNRLRLRRMRMWKFILVNFTRKVHILAWYSVAIIWNH